MSLAVSSRSPRRGRRRSAIALSLSLIAGLLPAAGASAPALAASGTLVINEIDYDQPGTDAAEFVEIKNVSSGAISLSGYSLVFINGTGGGATAYDTIALPAVSLAAGDWFVVCANAATVINCDLDDAPDTNFIQNGAPDAVAILQGTTVIDTVSYEGDTGAPYVEGSGTGLEDSATVAAAGISRCSDGVDTDQNNVDLVAAGITPGATNACHPVINEFSASTTGTDIEYVEVFAAPSSDLSALTILEIEGDGTGSGVVDEVIPVGTTGTSGLWLGSLPANALENGTISLLLVQAFSGALNDDLDTNNDGVFDVTPWTAIVDSVAVNDGGVGDVTYGSTALGPNYDGLSSFAPGGASRIPNGADTNTAADWVRNDFDLAGISGFVGSPIVGEALNTPGAPNALYVPPPTGSCGESAVRIHAIQGSGAASPVVGSEVKIEGIVVGDFQNNASTDNGDLNGFYVQEEDSDADADAATSEGIFVFAPGAPDVAVGDLVRVVGTVAEFSGSTQLGGVGGVLGCSTGNTLPVAAVVTLPAPSLSDHERFEGMRVTLPQELVISEYFNFDRFGEIVLTVGRQDQPTAVFEPGSSEAAALAQAHLLGRITLDDGRTAQNPDPAIHPNGSTFDLTNRFRGGDTVANVSGVLDFAFGLYRIHPTAGATYAAQNARPASPADVGGSMTVASFNVLNYFTTLDNAGPICGPLADQGCRGADDATEFGRQRTKIIAALAAMDADVVGLIEIENHPGDVPTADLVSGLNAALGPGTYDYVATGAIGDDAIRVALIYKPGTVTPFGAYQVLDSNVDSRFLDAFNRPVLAQTFVEGATGGVVTVAVNHLKSKGSDCNAVGDPDVNDGQGNCNLTRTAAAEAMVDWLAADPTGSGDRDVLIIGDLNSYDLEDPIDAIREGADDTTGTADDFTDLVAQFEGEFAYSFVFNGQVGYLDHALASATVLSQVTGATIWHINADEPDILDYDTTFKQAAQDALFEPNAYRSSDHDPVVIGLDLTNRNVNGFLSPVANRPAMNVAKAGSVVALNFSLGGFQGFDILAETPQVFMCSSSGWPLGTSSDLVTAGNSMLQYDALTDEYTIAWKTSKGWKESCRTVEIVFDDGSYRLADVTFPK